MVKLMFTVRGIMEQSLNVNCFVQFVVEMECGMSCASCSTVPSLFKKIEYSRWDMHTYDIEQSFTTYEL